MLKSKDGWTMGSASWDAELRYLGSGKGPDTLHYSRGHFPHRVMVPEMKKELQRGWFFIDFLRTACLCVCVAKCLLTRGKTFGDISTRVICGKMFGDNVTCGELCDCGTEDWMFPGGILPGCKMGTSYLTPCFTSVIFHSTLMKTKQKDWLLKGEPLPRADWAIIIQRNYVNINI